MRSSERLSLNFGVTFADLYSTEGLRALDRRFLDTLQRVDQTLVESLQKARAKAARRRQEKEVTAGKRERSTDLLLALAPTLESFIAQLFGIESALAKYAAHHAELSPIYRVKWKFIKRQALTDLTPEALDDFDPDIALSELEQRLQGPFDELRFSQAILGWQTTLSCQNASANDSEEALCSLELAKRYSAWAVTTDAGQHRHRHETLFQLPEPVISEHRLRRAVERQAEIPVWAIPKRWQRSRSGFACTTPPPTLRKAINESRYCLICHPRGKDSCAQSEQSGCPLEEHISEFHALRKDGWLLSALAMIMIENPMVAATGHRVCNDCKRSCIYQKQTPVDIPQSETQTLDEVLALPWGFEIYSLLSRWNPLNLARPYPRPDSGATVLVVGMGPAGFTLTHHLLNEGHAVVGLDSMKIEPLAPTLNGVLPDGSPCPFLPAEMQQRAEHLPTGFGGVSAYGITARWNKNYLTLIRLLLERRKNFCLIGGARFGSNLTAKQALEMGFDHIALATGAAPPVPLKLPNGLAGGVRMASDFLMSLQQGGAAQMDIVATNLQIQLPIAVIGGGLTAIDTATEALAYYPVQVEKFLRHKEALAANGIGQSAANTPREALIEQAFIAHASALRRQKELGLPLRDLLEKWGGATVVYRGALQNSPAYRTNPEELAHALEEGIVFAEHCAVREIHVDKYGDLSSLTLDCSSAQGDASSVQQLTLNARSLFVAIGTQPICAAQHPGWSNASQDSQTPKASDESNMPVGMRSLLQHYLSAGGFSPFPLTQAQRQNTCPSETSPLHNSAFLEDHQGVLLAQSEDGRLVSFLGDANSQWSGSVVKAMASAKAAYPLISRALLQQTAHRETPFKSLRKQLNQQLRARIVQVQQQGPDILTLRVEAPRAAQNWRPGQFFRLQNYAFPEGLPLEGLGFCQAPEKEHGEEMACWQITTGNKHGKPDAPSVGKAAPVVEEAVAQGIATQTRFSGGLEMEGLALTGAQVDAQKGFIDFVISKTGASSLLCQALQPGELVVLLGPTGSPSCLQSERLVILVGGGVGNHSLLPIGRAYREKGVRVLHFAGYRRLTDCHQPEALETSADTVVWCCDEAPGFPAPNRPQDFSFFGNVIDAIAWYASLPPANSLATDEGIAPQHLRLQEATSLMLIGSHHLMEALAHARQTTLREQLPSQMQAIAAVNSPMQCCSKGICAQCLQQLRNPHHAADPHHVFSCIQQDQLLDWIDFGNLNTRLAQNSLLENQARLWCRLHQLAHPGAAAP